MTNEQIETLAKRLEKPTAYDGDQDLNMMPNDLLSIAADVAAALGLINDPPGMNWQDGYKDWQTRQLIQSRGNDLSNDYWRCRCEDWLYDHKFMRVSPAFFPDRHVAKTEHWQVDVTCSLAEAPARLVSAVWRKMKP